VDPRSGEMVAEFRSSTAKEVKEAVQRARVAQRGWGSSGNREVRVAAIEAMEKVFARERESMVDCIAREVGFPRSDIAASYNSALRGIAYYVERYRSMVDRDFPLDQTLWPNTEARIVFEPQGVIGHIGIWNFPFWQTMITAIPALLVGNAIVFKPSEQVTMTGLRIAELMHECGVPRDVYIPLIGGAYVGRQLVRSDCDMLAFTGGMAAGNWIANHAGVRPLLLELSGNDAAVVCGDADLEQAAMGIATGTFARAGQVCIRIKRVYVEESVAEAFIQGLVAVTQRINVKERIGPLIREEARQEVDRVVIEAVDQGSRLLLGGKRIPGPGFFYEPTILQVFDDRLEVIREETFGPVCSVRVVKDAGEAIDLANSSRYGLGATIWTQDMDNAQRIASRLEVGNVWINEWGRTLACGEYFQGCKRSGIASASERLMLFMKKKTVITHRTSEPRPSWHK